MWKINVLEWWEKIQNKRYVVEINIVRLYLNTALTPQSDRYFYSLGYNVACILSRGTHLARNLL